MDTTDTLSPLPRRALLAYEGGRRQWSARHGALAAGIAAIALIGCQQATVPALCAVAILAAWQLRPNAAQEVSSLPAEEAGPASGRPGTGGRTAGE